MIANGPESVSQLVKKLGKSCVCSIEKLGETGKLSLCRGRALCDTVSLRPLSVFVLHNLLGGPLSLGRLE